MYFFPQIDKITSCQVQHGSKPARVMNLTFIHPVREV